MPILEYPCNERLLETGINTHSMMGLMSGMGPFLNELGNKLSSNRKDVFDFVCKGLMEIDRNYNWVGIYVLKDSKLVLEAYSGENTEHEIISLGEGLCSQAIVTNAVVNEADVKGNSKYLACFPSTKSELVVPIRDGNIPIGEIDVDSDTLSAFSREDEEFIVHVAKLISEKVSEASGAGKPDSC